MKNFLLRFNIGSIQSGQQRGWRFGRWAVYFQIRKVGA